MFILIALIIINIFIFMNLGGSVVKKTDGKEWTIYGTMGCGWTRKQLEHMKKVGKPYTFVDCDKGGCDGMSAFPTIRDPNGKETVGFSEI
jgi:hypothetical protein